MVNHRLMVDKNVFLRCYPIKSRINFYFQSPMIATIFGRCQFFWTFFWRKMQVCYHHEYTRDTRVPLHSHCLQKFFLHRKKAVIHLPLLFSYENTHFIVQSGSSHAPNNSVSMPLRSLQGSVFAGDMYVRGTWTMCPIKPIPPLRKLVLIRAAFVTTERTIIREKNVWFMMCPWKLHTLFKKIDLPPRRSGYKMFHGVSSSRNIVNNTVLAWYFWGI